MEPNGFPAADIDLMIFYSGRQFYGIAGWRISRRALLSAKKTPQYDGSFCFGRFTLSGRQTILRHILF